MSNARFLEKRVAEAFYGKFTALKEPQEAAIEPILAGRNLVLSSGTGSGKTEAVMAPLISRYWQDLFRLDSLAIVYISPTKALANDLHRRLGPPLDYLNLRIGIRHGDRDDLRKKTKPHVVITTPESVDVLLLRRDKALATVLAVVIDEAHLLYNTQRGIQLSVLIQRLQNIVARPPLQLVAMSATISNLLDTARLIFGRQSNTDFLKFASHRTIDALVRDDDSTSLVAKLTEAKEAKVLGFVNKRKYAECFAGLLSHESHLENCVFTHYSNLDALERRETEKQFAKRKTAVCYATSTLELGIDIGDIDVVMLLGVPSGIASFLQRIGRGNRRKEKANVVCFIYPEVDCEFPPKPPYEPTLIEALRHIALIDSAQKGELPSQHRYELFGAVAQQCLSVIASRKGKYTSLKELTKLFEHLGYVEEATLKSILDALAKRSFVTKHSFKTAYGAAEALHKLVAEKKIYGNFPEDLQTVKLMHRSTVIGEVHEIAIEAPHVMSGKPFLFAGRKWIFKKKEGDIVHVVPADPEVSGKPLNYVGSTLEFDAFLTDKMWHLIHAREFPYHLLHEDLQAEIEIARKVAQTFFSANEIPYVEGRTYNQNYIRYYTFGGVMVNTAIALLHGEGNAADITDCWLQLHSPVDWQALPSDPMGYESVFPQLAKFLKGRSIFQKLLPHRLQVREGIQEWLCDEAIGTVLRRLTTSKPMACTQRDRPFPLEMPLYLTGDDHEE